ncbi:MAG: hypothetical protein ACYTFY_08305 [Planctomycetota bacterium]
MSSAADSNEITVLKKGYLLYVRSYYSDKKDIVVTAARGSNQQFNFIRATLIDKDTPLSEKEIKKGIIIHGCGDDATPWQFNGTYIGGNHGCSDGLEINVTDHGFTEKDLGSEWQDGKEQKFYIIKIIDKDRFWILSENKGKGDIWRFNKAIAGDTLKNTKDERTFLKGKRKVIQMTPACRIIAQRYMVDGSTQLEDNKLTVCNFLNIVEEYDITAPDSMLAMVIKNAGKKIDPVDPEIDSVVNNKITYQFQPYGACVIDYKARVDRDFDLSYMGFIQTAMLALGKYEFHDYYIPKTKKFEQEKRVFDYKNIEDYRKRRDFGLFFMADGEMVEDKNNLPERFIQLLGNGNVRDVGYAAGYSLFAGITRPEIRSKNCKRALFLWKSQKTYPSAIDSKLGRIKKGQDFHCIAYRQYFQPDRLSKNATSSYINKQDGSYVLYADYHKDVKDEAIKLPEILKGKKFSIIEKTDSCEVLSESVTKDGEIKVSVTDGYGYCVLKFD